jgi:hypothetical protein
MNCWLLNPGLNTPPIVIAYIAVTDGGNIDSYAPRFVRTIKEHPPGVDCRIVIVCNGGPLSDRRRAYFDGLKCEFLERPNDFGWDISAYQHVARLNPDAFLCCFGESVHFHRRNWLLRMAVSRSEYGSGMYGFLATHDVRAHLNTTAFCSDARLLIKYPTVLNHESRYAFEHSYQSFWKRINAGGHTAAFVTFDGIWFPGEWRDPQNILHRGDQSNLLVWCNHVERYAHADPNTKQAWSARADSVFRL